MDECNPIINIFYRIALMQILCVLLARPNKSTHKIFRGKLSRAPSLPGTFLGLVLPDAKGLI